MQVFNFEYKRCITNFKLKDGILNNWAVFLFKQEWFILEVNSAFIEISEENEIIFIMLDYIVKVCKNNLNNQNISSKVLKTLELFSLGIEYILKYINEDKYAHELFLSFDKFIIDNIPKFIKTIIAKHSLNSLPPSAISNYFYKNVLHNHNVCIDYNIILSLLIGNNNITKDNIMYIPVFDENCKHFIPLFYLKMLKMKNLSF